MDAEDARARACLTAAVDPGDTWLGRCVDEYGPQRVWSALRGGTAPPGGGTPDGRAGRWRRWCSRAGEVDADRLLGESADAGIRFVVPGDPEWPGRLDHLAAERPYGIWVRGRGDLRHLCLRSVAVVGSRAASGYGLHVAAELSYHLAERSFTVVSGGAYGIDGAAHRAALAAGSTAAVLACGLDLSYPRGHESLFADVAAHGVLVSEHPLGAAPSRRGFLVRNRVIAALTPGTVVVEAGLRSGAMNTARHAQELNRVLMAVPGPVTSALSAGCHRLLRDWQAGCVTGAGDVAEQLSPPGEEVSSSTGSVLARDGLDPGLRAVLDTVPVRGGAGTATIAAAAGQGIDSTLRALGLLAAGGFVERTSSGWRVRP